DPRLTGRSTQVQGPTTVYLAGRSGCAFQFLKISGVVDQRVSLCLCPTIHEILPFRGIREPLDPFLFLAIKLHLSPSCGVDLNHTDRSSGRSLVLGRFPPLVASEEYSRETRTSGWRSRRYPSALTDY
ncbi:unnamed protein product, partial [Heterotrigona itama]